MTICYLLLIFMIIAAVVAVETRDLLSAVISVGAVGFFSSLLFLFLHAPDIALTQIVVEILALVILIRATVSRKITAISGDREFFGVVVSVGILLVILIAGVRLFDSLPAFGTAVFTLAEGSASPAYISRGLGETGAANLVAAVILDFRAYDTLGEATVLFASIIGATVILRKKSRKRLEEPDP